jgi:hypothetical protein
MFDRIRLWFFALMLIVLASPLLACGARREPTIPAAPSKAEEPAGPALFLKEGFDENNSGWLEAADAEASQGYRDGKFFFEVRAPDLFVWDNPGVNVQDFVLLVKARQVSGGSENSYGVLVRYVDEGNFYRFDLSGDGRYAVFKLENAEWVPLADWQASAYVRPQGEVNLIQIDCQGPTMTFYANDQELIGVQDRSFERGDVGLLASTFADPHVEVEFDDLEIREVQD